MGGRSSNDLSLQVILSAQDKASGALRGFGSTLASFAGNLGPVVTGLFALGGIIVGVGAKATQMAAQFQQSMLALVAHAGLAKSQFNQVSDAVLNMAGQVGQTPTALAQALYPILSGFSGIQDQAAKTKVSLEELRLAAMSTAGTTADTTTVAKAATAAFNAYGMASNNTATNIKHMNSLFDIMNQTVTEGNMQWSNYATKIGDLAAKASQSGIKFTEANAALAVFTNTGESVQLAGTHLGALFQTMSLDVDTLAKRANKLTAAHVHYAYVLKDVHGLMVKVRVAVKDTSNAFDVHAFKAMDLAGKLKYLEKITGGDEGKLKAILGNKTLAATYLKLMQHGKDYQNALKDLNHAQGATKKGFDTASQGFNQAMNRAKASIDALFIKIGNALLPILTKLVGAVAPAVTWFTNFASAVSHNEVAMAFLKGALIAFAGVALGVLIPAFVGWAIAAGAAALTTLAAVAPLLLIGAVIAAVIGGIILAYQHWGQIMDWISGKAEQTRIKVELEHSKMAQATDEKTIKAANKAIANYEKQRQGILQKLKETHDPAERRELEHQLKMLNIQEDAQKKRLQKAEEDKKRQLAKQKELHQQMLKAQQGWFFNMLSGIAGFFGNIFNWLGTNVHNWITSAEKWRDGVVKKVDDLKNQAIQKLKDMVTGLIQKAEDFRKGIIQKLEDMRSGAIKKVQDLITGIKNFFTNLPGQALQWGKDMIQGFINGIGQMIGGLGQQMNNIGNTIKNFLHFSKPDKGPLVDVDTWMPDMMDLMTKGIIAGNPKLLAAVQMTSKTVAGVGTPPPALSGSVPYGRPPMSSNSYSSSYAGGNVHNGDIIIQGAGQNPDAIADRVIQKLNFANRRSGSMRVMTSGGKGV